jgi:type II secretory pathway component PulF
MNCADYLEFVHDTRRKVISAMSILLLSSSSCSVLAVALIVKIVPMFQEVYQRFGAELPLPTQMLIKVSRESVPSFLISLIGFIVFFSLS